MKNNKGITLIVLIITVIIMLILVAVVIDIANDGKLIDSAKEAVDKTNEKVGQTQNRVDELMEIMEQVKPGGHNWTRTGDVITCSHCEAKYTIGEPYEYICGGTGTSTILGSESGTEKYMDENDGEVPEDDTDKIDATTGNQTITRDSNTTWVVLGIADPKTLLITTSKPTDDYYYLYGEYAYNNGIEILDKVCKDLYGENARGMTMENVDGCFNYEPEGGWYFDTPNRKYVCIGNFTTRIDALSIWNNIKSNGTHTPDGTNTEAKLGSYLATGYYYGVGTSEDTKLTLTDESQTGEITENEINVIFGEDLDYNYWLASRGADVTSITCVSFGPGSVAEGYAGNYSVFFDSSNEFTSCSSYAVRPVVSII